MKMKVLEEKDNPVLKRKELKIELDYEGGPTPKLDEVAEAIAKERDLNKELVEVSKIFSMTGKAAGTAFVKIWESVEAREAIKPKKREVKAGGKTEAKEG